MRYFMLIGLSLLLLNSCHGTKAPEPSPPAAATEAETQPKTPTQQDRVKEEALRQLGTGELGIFSIHPDAKDAPPNIFSPDAFPKAKPEAAVGKSKQ